MNEQNTYKGIWWLSDTPSRKVSGSLSILSNGDVVLESIGELEDNDFLSSSSNNSQLSTIWGVDSNDTPISAFGFEVGISQNTSCSFSIVRYNVQVAVIGAHLKSWDEKRNYNVKVCIPELSLWYRPNCLKFCQQGNGISWTTNTGDANEVSVPIEDGCQLQIASQIKIIEDNYGLKMEIEQESMLHFDFSFPISMQEAKRKVFSFEQFLSFATLTPIQCSHFWLIDKDEKTTGKAIEVIERKYPRKVNDRFWEYLFLFDTIKDSFSKIITKWFGEKELFPIRTHLIDSISHKGYFEANDFLIVVQAIEGFYYRFRKEDKLSNIIDNLINEFSDIRIQEISKNDIPSIRDTRNHLSHLLPSEKKKHVLHGKELYNLNHKLRKLLICCVLNLIGFSNEEMNNLFDHSRNSYLRMINGEQRHIAEDEVTKLDADVLSTTIKKEIEPE